MPPKFNDKPAPPPPDRETRQIPMPEQQAKAQAVQRIEPLILVDELWFDRAKQLAAREGVTVSAFVEELIRKRWALGPMAHPRPRSPGT